MSSNQNQQIDKSIKNSPEMYKLYCSLMKTILDNINYYISKKNDYYQEIIDKTKQYLNQIEKDCDLNADKYYPIIAKSILVENYKLGKYVFTNLNKVIKNNFLLGRTPLSKFDIKLPTVEDKTEDNDNNDLKIIDLIIESLTSVDLVFQDDDIWLYVLECVEELVLNINIFPTIKGNSFKKIYVFYFRLYKKFKDEEDKQNSIKEKIIYLLNNSMNNLISVYGPNYIIEPSSNDKKKSNNNDNNNNSLINLYEKLGSPESKNDWKLNNYNPIDLYICRQVKSMIDIICFRAATRELYNKNKKISLLIPSKNCDFVTFENKYLRYPEINNEYSYGCGFFGWCYICRRTANHYSIDFRVSICSYACKAILENEEENLGKSQINLVKDCPKFFKYICQLLSDKTSSNKEKLMALNLIQNMLNDYGEQCLKIHKSFIKVVKEDLSEGLFNACLSTDMDIFTISISLFFIIWKLFRENLRQEINFFNMNVFLKILSSTNSSFIQKKIILENFLNCDFKYFVELYANYDCRLNEKFTITSIVTAFSEIVKGRFSRSPQSFSEQENYELVNLALKTLTSMAQSIFEITEKDHPLPKNSMNSEINLKGIMTEKNEEKTINPLDYTTSNLTDKIESNLKKKYELQNAAEKFNYKIKLGIHHLKKIGFINDNSPIDTKAKNIMLFFRNTPNLKKRNIGEFLGENTEISIKTLKYFAESFDFKGVHIIQALRIFLSTFQLPSEGQKIDRVLESFAAKYHNDNPTIFGNADGAFYLSYAIMILQTELHNPNVREKMSLESFMKLVEGKNSENLTKEYLSDIYNQIQNDPLSLSELEEEREKNTEDKIEEKYAREKQRIVNEYNYNNKLAKNKDIPYIRLKDYEISEYLSQFISSIWKPLITMYSVVIEESDDKTLYNQGISGISNCIKIFGLLNLNTQKQTIISFLCVMTNLLQIKPLKKKNILCIKEILYVANIDYRYVKGSWNLVFDIINKLHYYILLNSMPKDERDEIFNQRKVDANNNRKNSNAFEEMMNLEKEIMKNISSEITMNDYEKIFSKTLNFDSSSLIEFINSISEITKKEFKENSITKIFFLQKLVEVAEINILCRPRFNINNIWMILSEFFIETGISNNIENSSTSIDSLRQLTTKFLQKKESKDYHFQEEVFKPFLEIAKKSQDTFTQEYVNCCINNLVRNNCTKIKSGWITVLNIFEQIFKSEDDPNCINLQSQSLDTLVFASLNNFKDINEIFADFVNHLKLYINQFPEKVISVYENFVLKVDNENNFKTLLNCYPPLMLHSNEKIRNQTLTNFSDCLNKRLKQYKTNLVELVKDPSFWKYVINEVLLSTVNSLMKKILSLKNNNDNSFVSTNNNSLTNINVNSNINNNNINKSMENQNIIGLLEKEKYCNTLENLLIKIGNLFQEYFYYNYKELTTFFSTIEKIIFSGDENVLNTGLECIKFLHGSEKMKNVPYLHSFTFFLTTLANKSLERDFITMDATSLKNQIRSKKNNSALDSNIYYSYIHCNIISLIDKLLMQYMQLISLEDLNKLLEGLESSIIISNQFNSKIELRFVISDYCRIYYSNIFTTISTNGVINLYKQFQISIKNYYSIMNYFFSDNHLKIDKQLYFQRVLDFSILMIKDYINKSQEFTKLKFNDENNNESEKEFEEKKAFLYNFQTPLCEFIFPVMQKIEFYNDDKYMDIISKLLLELIMCYDQRIRFKVRDLLSVIFVKIIKNK